jgi:hypothetical protein
VGLLVEWDLTIIYTTGGMIFKKILFTKICPHPKFKKKFLARNLKSHTFGGWVGCYSEEGIIINFII